MKKNYLSDLIGAEYKKWQAKKVFITAPTGMGKTTFVLEKMLPYHAAANRKVLILCNRKLLRKQYWYSIAQKFSSYTEFENWIEIMTYQQLAEHVKAGKHRSLLDEFSVICCDECHYFYADSDFNGFGTYVLLHVLVNECIRKQMIFMTATMNEVKPLILNIINRCITKIRVDSKYEDNCTGFREILNYDYMPFADYSRIKCIYAPDLDTLCGELGNSKKKSIIFVDDKHMAEDMQQRFLNMNLGKNDVAIFNAENLEEGENSKVVERLVMCNKLLPRILITTSVLDNGVSVQDSEVENVAIITESQLSFLQMLGRVRAESTEFLKLYFLAQPTEVFAKREKRLCRIMETISEIEKVNYDSKRFDYLHIVWENSNKELAEVYRKIFVWGRPEYNLFYQHSGKVYVQYGNICLCLNYFAKEKLGANYLAEARFHMLSMISPIKVAEEQMKWIKKNPEELVRVESTYREKQIQDMREELLLVNDCTLTELRDVKEKISKRYRKDFFADVVFKNGSFSTEKFCQILERFGLKLIEGVSNDGTKRYSVVEKEG